MCLTLQLSAPGVSVSASEPRVHGREDVRREVQGGDSGEADVSLFLHLLLLFLASLLHLLLLAQEEEDLQRAQLPRRVCGSAR